MLLCFRCEELHTDTPSLISHLRFQHGFYPTSKCRLVCAQHGCRKQFSTYSGFRKHLDNIHVPRSVFANVPHADCLSQSDAVQTGPSDEESLPEAICFESRPVPSKKDVKDMCASIVAKLQGSGASNTSVSSIICDLEEFTTELQSLMKQNFVTEDSSEMSAQCFENPFTSFNSDAKRAKFFSERWGIVEPLEIVLGVRYDSRRNKRTGTYDQVPVKETFVYIPILDTLKFMFRNTDICKHFETEFQTTPDVYKDFSDGSYCKGHPLFSQHNSLKIQLYYDDFETSNPLGSKHGIHKIGCLYFVLRNLPPKFNSAVLNIHLVSLFHSQDVKKYGFDAILAPLINDVKILEVEGIDLPISSEKVYGSICQISGDNLGMNAILGFTESFNSNYYCRLCLTEKSDAQDVYSEDDPRLLFRDEVSFQMHCRDIQSDPQLNSVYGVKRNCSLNTLHYFHVCSNYSFDIMHDILEGVAQYEMKLLFGYLTENLISKNDLLLRIYSFDFGYTERKNRPTNVSLEHGGNSIGLNSIQTLCLVRNTPLIFGDLVPPGNPNWNLLLILLQIINIVFSPVVTYGMTVFLKHLISEHHQLFKSVYPHKKLIPKHHFMVHYPSCIRKIGPLLHFWSMRFEAKHKLFKNMLKSFKNITKSLARKHQMAIGSHWETLSLQRKEFGPMNFFSLNDCENGEDLARALQVTVQADIYSTRWVKLDGTEYRPGLVICTNIKNELPFFSKITNILVLGEKVYFLVDKLVTELFSEHYNAFRVVDGNEFDAVVPADDLKHYKPYDLQSAYGPDVNVYVVPLQSFVMLED